MLVETLRQLLKRTKDELTPVLEDHLKILLIAAFNEVALNQEIKQRTGITNVFNDDLDESLINRFYTPIVSLFQEFKDKDLCIWRLSELRLRWDSLSSSQGSLNADMFKATKALKIIGEILSGSAGYAQTVIEVKTSLDAAILAINQHSDSFENRDHQLQAKRLCFRLQQKTESFFKDRRFCDEFQKNNFIRAMQQEISFSPEAEILRIHRGAKQVMANVGIALTGVGIFVLIGRVIYSKIRMGRASFFQVPTHSSRLMERVTRQVESIQRVVVFDEKNQNGSGSFNNYGDAFAMEAISSV